MTLQERFLTALRSGDYKQGTNHLRDGDYFCALGVACDVASRNHWELMPDGSYRYLDHADTIPSSIQSAYGLSPEACDQIMDMNDGMGCTFEQIASFIEKYDLFDMET